MATYYGGSGNDSQTGSIGADSLFGYGGNDTINANGGNDTIFGGDGADSINAGFGNDMVYAEAGNDTVVASNGYDMVFGGAGNDNLSGGSDLYDDLFGGTGDDSLYGGSYGENWVYGGDGNDLVYGGNGSLDTASGGIGNDTVYGGLGDDTVLGGTGNDLVYGEAGNDFAAGDDGADTVDGGTGSDTVEGGQGNDSLIGGDGADLIRGDIRTFDPSFFASGASTTATTVTFTNTSALTVKVWYIDPAGTPVLYATLAPGQSWGGNAYVEHNWMLTDAATGSQLAVYEGGVSQTNNFSGVFNDTISGGQGADTISGDFGDDSIDGGTENDSITGGSGSDSVFGGWGDDYADLGDGNDVFGDWNLDSGNDTVYGGTGNDAIIGASENDLLYGGTGDDTLYGGHGNDSSYGGAGNDVAGITEDHMQDFYDLGENTGDFDALSFGNYLGTSGVTATFSATDAGSYTYGSGLATGSFVGVEAISGTGYADTLNAGADTDGVTLLGNAGNDSLIGGSGNDQLDGGEGDDTIYFGQGTDSVYGGAGNDQIDDSGGWMDGGATYIDVGTGNDLVWSGGGNDTVYGNDGSDTVYGETGADLIYGGAGNDALSGDDDNDTLAGGGGADSLYGGAGNDSVDAGSENDSVWLNTGDDGLLAGTGDDVAFGGWGNDTLYGEAGNDSLEGDEGSDSLFGGGGNDSLYGGAESDVLKGGANDDRMEGGTGSDVFQIGEGDGSDTIVGGEDAGDFDTLVFTGTTAGVAVVFSGAETGTYSLAGGSTGSFSEIEAVQGTDLADTLNASASTSSVNIAAGAGNDLIHGGTGADHVNGGDGDDTAYGGDGHDTLNGDQGNDLLYGGVGNDWLLTGNGDDSAYGGAGDDYLSDMSGNSLLVGGDGRDTFFGGDGNDTLQGGAGDDALTGGSGTDSATFTGPVTDYSFDYLPGGGLQITDTVAGRDGTDTLTDVEYVTFGGTTYRLVTGDDGSNTTLQGPAGEPALIIAHDGNDWGGGHATSDAIFGGAGNDTLDGGDGNDTLVGEADDDLLRGDGGNDALFGGTGNDTLQGGAGDDALTGGAGQDLFELVEAGGGDTVTDFEMGLVGGLTTDQLNVSALQNPDNSPVRSWDVTVSDDGNGNALLTFPEGETLVLQGVSPASVTAPGMLASMGVPCFAAGTRIMTPQGPRAVERLRVGDLVSLAAGGGAAAPILWTGQRSLQSADLAARPGLRPIRIRAGSHGALRDLILSPQHAVAIFNDQNPALVRAGHLARLDWGARQALGMKSVQYHHLFLPEHALILAEGVQVESLYPGKTALAGFAPQDRLALLAALVAHRRPAPGQGPAEAYGPRCLPLLTYACAREWQATRNFGLLGMGNQSASAAMSLVF